MKLKENELLLEYPLIVKSLYYNQVLSITDVSNYIGKSIPHVHKLLTDLKDKGFISERGLAHSTGGRKPLTFSLAKEYYIISVALDRFSANLAVVDMQNNFIGGIKHYELDLQQISVDFIIDIIDELIDGQEIDKEKIIAVGITIPGFVDTIEGINYTYKNLGSGSLSDYIQRKIQLPVFIENDSTAIALAEQKFGVAANSKNVMVINLGWGVGLGMILNDQIFRGNNGLAGEFSHLPLFNNGKLCSCGKYGCLETEASLITVEQYAKEATERGEATTLANYPEITAGLIIDQALNGDRLAVKLISDAAYHVGQGLAILIHLMNPRYIVLSGKGAEAGKLWLAPIEQALNEHCIPRLTGFTEIKISDLANRAQLIGSAVLVIESLGEPLKQKMEQLETVYA